jgi:uracil-DNA glycosylase
LHPLLSDLRRAAGDGAGSNPNASLDATMSMRTELTALDRAILACERCPRLREYCVRVAREKRAAFREWTYHGRPVPNFGDPAARILIVGLAPAAHGANRTGRMFTGDRSGDFLIARLHEADLANQGEARSRDDGLALRDCFITAVIHCAPPANKPTPNEIENCAPFLEQTFDAFPQLRVVVALGRLAFDQLLRFYRRRGWIERPAAYRFAHGAVHRFAPPAPSIVCSFHPSQQNTFTGRLTAPMLRDVFERVRTLSR